ncbi:ATP-binding cassette domain-containing protein [Pseudomonas aeruginosa]|uniref:ABC transporter ATP-binding protein n=21 Tax=Gammaproteobacteria TaxID=1236 RepID=UPI000651E9ED
MYSLQVEDIHKRYGSHEVLRGVSLRAGKGDVISIIGSSGSGKSTFLRCVNFLEKPCAGRIRVGDEELRTRPGALGELRAADPRQLQKIRSRLAMVFQHFNLWSHLTVLENVVECPVNVLRMNRDDAVARARHYLAKVGLAEKVERQYPCELSGGQQQRVALARALAPEPLLLLLDEPFSNLDVELRRSLSQEVREILKARGTSAILVTHDQEEAFAVCDHIGVFKEGHLEQWDTPYNLYHEPLTPFVASFVGQGYFIRGQLLSPDTVQTELGVIRGNRAYSLPSGSAVDVLLRPDDLVHAPQGELKARIVGKTFLGAATLYRLQLPTGTQLESIFPSHADHQPGDDVGIRVAADHLVVFAARGSVAAHLAPVQA